MAELMVEFDASKKLEEVFKNLPDNAEHLINEYFEKEAAKNMMQEIIGLTPVSKKNKRHAKNSDPYKAEMFNLGFRIYAKGGAANSKNSFGYLVFPNDGRGPRNHTAQQFFERGAEKAEKDKIIDDLLEILAVKAIKD